MQYVLKFALSINIFVTESYFASMPAPWHFLWCLYSWYSLPPHPHPQSKSQSLNHSLTYIYTRGVCIDNYFLKSKPGTNIVGRNATEEAEVCINLHRPITIHLSQWPMSWIVHYLWMKTDQPVITNNVIWYWFCLHWLMRNGDQFLFSFFPIMKDIGHIAYITQRGSYQSRPSVLPTLEPGLLNKMLQIR